MVGKVYKGYLFYSRFRSDGRDRGVVLEGVEEVIVDVVGLIVFCLYELKNSYNKR